jgi:hypothetical protein
MAGSRYDSRLGYDVDEVIPLERGAIEVAAAVLVHSRLEIRLGRLLRIAIFLLLTVERGSSLDCDRRSP